MNLFQKPAVKVLLSLELLAIAGYVINYISLNQLLVALGIIMLVFVLFVVKWSKEEKEENEQQ